MLKRVSKSVDRAEEGDCKLNTDSYNKTAKNNTNNVTSGANSSFSDISTTSENKSNDSKGDHKSEFISEFKSDFKTHNNICSNNLTKIESDLLSIRVIKKNLVCKFILKTTCSIC